MGITNVSLNGCWAQIYDEQNNLIFKARIKTHDKSRNEIEIDACPALKRGDGCRVCIAASPVRLEYQGRVTASRTLSDYIALYHEKEGKENRSSPRYKTNGTAMIKSLIYRDCAYALHQPLSVTLMDISTGGARICAPSGAMSVGDRFEMSIKAGSIDKLLLAEVVNTHQGDSAKAEYGCRLYANGNTIKKRM